MPRTVALIGSHGTGKTTVFRALQGTLDAAFVSESVRTLVPALGRKTAYELVDEFGIGAFELMVLGGWSVIDPALNPLLAEKPLAVIERSPLENYAYFLEHQDDRDITVAPLVRELAARYVRLVNEWIYFPLDVVPLVGDEMRRADPEYQRAIDERIWEAATAFGIAHDQVYALRETSVDGRVQEILARIGKGS